MIVLNMIVRNEAHCLARCLRSVLPFVDAAVVVDTGSTDRTQEVIKEELSTKEHVLLSAEWVDFSYNRTKAFWAARDAYPKANYAFVLDADETVSIQPDFVMPPLDRSGYAIWQTQDTCRFLQPRLFKLSDPWVYQGAIHEVAECLGGDGSRGIVEGLTITGHFDSARNQQGLKVKCARDAAVMETMPETPRNVFYKAQCYRDAGDLNKALALYKQRAEMGDFVEEVYLSLLISAQIMQLQEMRPSLVAAAYESAWKYRPTRAEAPYYLAKFLEERNHPMARTYFEISAQLPMTTDQQGIDMQCYGPIRSEPPN